MTLKQAEMDGLLAVELVAAQIAALFSQKS